MEELKNDILQYSIDVRNPVDQSQIIHALIDAGIEVVGISFKSSWTDKDYWAGKPGSELA